jgi:hypothetical protein
MGSTDVMTKRGEKKEREICKDERSRIWQLFATEDGQ